jgi:hypothetical protein
MTAVETSYILLAPHYAGTHKSKFSFIDMYSNPFN